MFSSCIYFPLPFPNPSVSCLSLTDILNLHIPTAPRTQIRPQRAVEQLLQHLEAHARERGVVAALAELVADERIYKY